MILMPLRSFNRGTLLSLVIHLSILFPLAILTISCVNIEKIRLPAEQGDPVAQYRLGRIYERGDGVPRSFRKAETWYKKSADQGYSVAQNDLGSLYQEGQGVQQNYKLAMEWYRKAAVQGNALAQLNLGWMYDRGMGVRSDDSEAIKWYEMSAGRGHARAQLNLGIMYWRGEGAKKDLVESYKWLSLVNLSKDGAAIHRAIVAFPAVQRAMTEEEIAKGDELLKEWRPRPADIVIPSQRFEQKTFSFIPPQEEGWVISYRSDQKVEIKKRGDHVDETYAVRIQVLDIPGIQSDSEFLSFIKGQPAMVQGNRRFRRIQNEVELSQGRSEICGEYHIKIEDHEPVKRSEKQGSMIMENIGFICRHPDDEDLYINFEYSHRYYPGDEDPDLEMRAAKFTDEVKFKSNRQ